MKRFFPGVVNTIRRAGRRYLPQRVPRRTVKVNGIALDLADHPTSVVRDEVAAALEDDLYGIETVAFCSKDIVIDIGANIGMVSLYIARKFPDVTVYAYEPIPANYAHLLQNIGNNGVGNIRAFNVAVTGDGRDIDMVVHPASNTGGATACLGNMRPEGHEYHRVRSITLDEVFAANNIERCRLLKIDCEGSEHEMLLSTRSLGRIDFLSAEFHINRNLETKGYSIERLTGYCRKYFAADKLRIHSVRMAE